jgi:hypothetical protein
MVRNVRGVVGITNIIVVKPRVSPGQIQAKIEEAFKREAEIDARHIWVEISDHTARIYGVGAENLLHQGRCSAERHRHSRASGAWRASLASPGVR